MTARWMGAIPKTPEDVADNLDLWELASTLKDKSFLRRALRRAAGTIRELVAERNRLRARVAELEGEAELALWRKS